MNHYHTKHLLIIVALVVMGLVYALRVGLSVTQRAFRFDKAVYVVTARAVAQWLGFCMNNDPDCPLSSCVPTAYSTLLPVARCTSERSQ